MRVKNAPYWVLIVVMTPLTPIARVLMRRECWPYNKGGPMDRAWNRR